MIYVNHASELRCSSVTDLGAMVRRGAPWCAVVSGAEPSGAEPSGAEPSGVEPSQAEPLCLFFPP